MSVPTVLRRRNNPIAPLAMFGADSVSDVPDNVNVAEFEAIMDRTLGCQLAELDLGENGEFVALSERYFTHFGGLDHYHSRWFDNWAGQCFDPVMSPPSMFYETKIELIQAVFAMYQLSYHHYVLGRNNGINGRFPYYCCGTSCRNLVSALWEAGFVAAVKVSVHNADHAYVVVPYVLGSPSIKGVILIDPTSDQLMNKRPARVRNDVRILPPSGWSYRTDWCGGTDLYPTHVEISAFSFCCRVNYNHYITDALNYPVVVQ